MNKDYNQAEIQQKSFGKINILTKEETDYIQKMFDDLGEETNNEIAKLEKEIVRLNKIIDKLVDK